METKKILIIDDEDDFRGLLETRLVSEGYQVVSAVDGGEGFEKAKQELPDLILLDVMMPKVDGYTALKMLKDEEKTSNIPVVVLTCKKEMKDLFAPEKVHGYIVKPYEKDDLLETIKKAIG